MGTYWEDEVRKALHMELVEQRDRQLRDTRNAYRCVCGKCEEIQLKNFAGNVVVTELIGPCRSRISPAPIWRPAADQPNTPTAKGAGVLRPPPAPGGWSAPLDLDNVYNSSDMAATDVELWRSLWFGWHGRLYAGHETLDRWWRPFRRFAEYRGSYVLLRYLEHRDREPLDLAGY